MIAFTFVFMSLVGKKKSFSTRGPFDSLIFYEHIGCGHGDYKEVLLWFMDTLVLIGSFGIRISKDMK